MMMMIMRVGCLTNRSGRRDLIFPGNTIGRCSESWKLAESDAHLDGGLKLLTQRDGSPAVSEHESLVSKRNDSVIAATYRTPLAAETQL